MRHAARVTMSMRELDRLKCIQAVVDGDLSLVIVAERLGISTRQLRRIAQRYRAEGPNGLISRRCSRPSNNRLDASLEVQVVKILRESYPDFGPTLAAEKLQQRHGITVAKETIRRVQMDAGLWIPRKLRPPKVQQPRARRACFYVSGEFCDRQCLKLTLSGRRQCQQTGPQGCLPAQLMARITHCVSAAQTRDVVTQREPHPQHAWLAK